MANALFSKGKEKILRGEIDLINDTIKVAMINQSAVATVDTALNEFFADVSVTKIGVDATLSGKSVTGGVFNANSAILTAVETARTAGAIVIYKDTGNASTSPLIAFYNVISGFPFTTDGDDVKIKWNTGASKIFSI